MCVMSFCHRKILWLLILRQKKKIRLEKEGLVLSQSKLICGPKKLAVYDLGT